ncbi:M48 family metalloprotease [Amycolatopsis sacchari]|uniref:M48 family metalloprotease n=1 Tax=Amycolatopsis sacchari TaxID=115433 RepID=UPI003D766580
MDSAALTRATIDPRVLVAGTTIRFLLLLVLLLISSVSMASFLIGNGIFGTWENGWGCLLAAGADPNSGDLLSVASEPTQNAAYVTCMARFASSPPWWLVPAWLLLVVLAAAILFCVLPAWRGRRGRVVPLDLLDSGVELDRELSMLVETAGLARSPRFVVAPAAATTSAVVYGRFRRHTVCLHGGLVARRSTDPGGFRAVVLHELAHIRNGDVGLTYATVALWRVFFVGVLVPYTWGMVRIVLSPSNFWTGGLPVVVRGVALATVMVVLVYLARADVLRNREIYADLDALGWGADIQRWRRMATPHAARSRLASFTELWHSHPRWHLRHASLLDPAPLFGMRAFPMFLTGVIAALVEYQTVLVPSLVSSRLTVVLVIAGIAAGIVGTSAWRGAIHSLLVSGSHPSGARAGLWLGTGFVAGELVTNATTMNTWLPRQPETLLLPVIASVVLTWWATECAHLWSLAWRGRGARLIVLAGVAALWLVFAAALSWWDAWGYVFADGWPYPASATRQSLDQMFPGPDGGHSVTVSAIAALGMSLESLVSRPLGLPGWASTVMWSYPFLTYLAASATKRQRWLDRLAGSEDRWPRQEAPPARPVVVTGVIGGVLGCAGAGLVMVYLHPGRPALSQSLRYELIFQAWALVVLVGVATATAAVMVLRVQAFRLVAAMTAAHLALLIGFAGAAVLVALDGCLGPMNILGRRCHALPGNGWLFVSSLLPLALVLTTITTSVVALTRVGVRNRKFTRPLGASRGPKRIRVSIMVILVVIAAGITAAVEPPLAGRVSADGSESTGGLMPAPGTASGRPSSPKILALQVYWWGRYGGLQLLRDVNDALGRFTTAYQEATDGPEAGIVKRDNFRPACSGLQRATQGARTYFRIPDQDAQQSWDQVLTRSETGSAECLRSFESGDRELFLVAIRDLTTAVGIFDQLLVRISALRAAGGG